MDYQKLDARLAEALSAPDGHTEFEVFVEIARDAADGDVDRLARLGVRRLREDEAVVTAQLSRAHVGDVSDVPAVRYVRLSRRLRHS